MSIQSFHLDIVISKDDKVPTGHHRPTCRQSQDYHTA